jgi:[acyl-carrier-protein] S-malonyltransferase
MAKSAFLFPGQGAQVVGMGASLRKGSPAAAAVFEKANSLLGFDLAALCETGPQSELDRTDIAQPAIYVVSCAALAAMAEKGLPAEKSLPDGNGTPVVPAFAAGLSLGEFTALHYAGAFSFEDGLRLVRKRGQLMQQAAEATPGGMVSVLGLDEAKVRELCAEASAAVGGKLLVPSNFLCPGNIVLSGDKDACRVAAELAEKKYSVKAVPLAVAGAFHTAHMTPAGEGLSAALAATALSQPRIPVIANATAAAHPGVGELPALLVRQLDGPVLWEQSMRRLLDSGVELFYEIGPGRVLAGLLKRIQRSAKVVNLQTAEDVAALSAK